MRKNYNLLTKSYFLNHCGTASAMNESCQKPNADANSCDRKPMTPMRLFRILPILVLTALCVMTSWAQTYNYQRFTSSDTWTVPANANTVIIDCWGGGGGGATSTGSGNNQQGGGGGGGGFARYQTTSYSGKTLSVVVGAGGTANNNGETSSVAISGQTAFLSATGGSKGGLQTGGNGGSGSGSNVTNGNRTGGEGGNGYYENRTFGDRRYAGGGGGAAGYTGSIINPTFQNGSNGANGSNSGSGNGGNGYASVGTGSSGNGTKGSNSSSDNKDGSNYGGGGGGGADGSSRNPNPGGAGAPGYVLITYTLNCAVTLNANGGTLAPDATTTFTCVQGTAYGNNFPTNPTKEGYTFAGWYTDPTGGTKVETSTICPDQDEITLYAHYVGELGTTVENTYSPTGTGNFTWPAPEGTYKVTVEAWGGGGRGGNATDNYSVGSGGGGGAYVKYTAVGYNFYNNGNTTISGVVGAGATAGSRAQDAKATTITGVGMPTGLQANAGGNGEMKGNPSNGTTLTANGGTGGSKSTIAGVVSFEGGTGGSATTKRNGSTRTVSASGAGGKGGNTAGTQTDGGGGGGQSIANNANNKGNNGFAPGGGGSGARRSGNSGTTYSGGAGGNGKVLITYEILKIAITCKYQDGTTPDRIDSVLYYTRYDLGTPSRTGYSFEGWYDAAVGGNLFPISDVYTDTTSKIVYAHWEILPGAIANVDTTINPCTNAHVRNLTLPSDNNGYKWTCTHNGTTDTIYGKGATLDTVLSVPGTYAFQRFVVSPISGKSILSEGTYTVTVLDYNAGTLSVDNNSIYLCGSYAISQAPAQIINGTGNFSYKWTYKKDNEAENNLSVSTAALPTEQHPALTIPAAYTFYRYARPESCSTDNMYKKDSVVVTLNHTDPGTITYNGGEIYPCGNFSIAGSEVTSSSSTISYKWTCNGDSIANTKSISQADTTLAVDGTYTFIRYVKSDCGNEEWQSDANTTCTVTVTPIPGGTITANPTNIAPRGTYAITSTDQGDRYTYQWAYKKPGESNYTEISGATGKDLSNAPVLSALGNYEFIRYTNIPGCDCQAGTTTCNIEVQLESHDVCFETPGEQTWPAPEGTYKVTIEAWGGGGAGGGAPVLRNSSGNAQRTRSVGGGGGGGAYAQSSISNQNFHIQPFTVSVGNGGAASAADGEDGDPSTVVFNTTTLVKADGGKGGKSNSSTSSAVTAAGGAGGRNTESQGTTLLSGGNGETGNAGSNSGAGGKGAGTFGGVGGTQVECDAYNSIQGEDGSEFGGGGSGAINRYTTTAQAGGAGGDGKVCLTYEILELQLTTNVNHDNIDPTSTYILYYDTVPVSNPTREGYVFTGWYDAPTGGTRIEFDSTDNKDFALYNFDKDTMVYAHWKLENAGTIANQYRTSICVEEQYLTAEVSPTVVDNPTYKWECEFWPKEGGASRIINIDTNKPVLSYVQFPITESGVYEFSRLVQDPENPSEFVRSQGTAKFLVISPKQNIEGLLTNVYDTLCVGGSPIFTFDTDKVKLTVPDVNNPSETVELLPDIITYKYHESSSSSVVKSPSAKATYFNPYPGSIEKAGKYEFIVECSYQGTGCVATSDTVEVVVVGDPEFTSEPLSSKDEICPSDTTILTAGNLQSSITNDQPYTYTWQIYDEEDENLLDVGTEATYEYEQNGRIAHVHDFIRTGDLTYNVIASNILGCNASNEDDIDDAYIMITDLVPPTVSKQEVCPSAELTHPMEATAEGGNTLIWYADAVSEPLDDQSTPQVSLVNEDTVVYYVAQTDVSCTSARIPDTVVVRYTAHIAHVSGDLQQTGLRQKKGKATADAIAPITFSFDGNSYPTALGLPAGVSGTIDTLNQTYTISGTPTESGTFNPIVKLQDLGDCPQPQSFDLTLQVNASYDTTIYASMCPGEEFTVSDTKGHSFTLTEPGAHSYTLQSVTNSDSIVNVVYTVSSWNQFGFVDNDTLIAGWSAFSSAASPIQSDVAAGVMKSVSNITYSDWNGENTTRDGLTSTSPFITTTGKSLGLASGAWTSWIDPYYSNNGKFIEIQTSTKGYSNIKLQFDYSIQSKQTGLGGTDHAFAEALFLYSVDDGNTYDTVPQLLNATIQGEGTSVDNFELDLSTLVGDVIDNVQSLKLKVVFDQSEAAAINIATSPVTYFGIDNIAITGTKSIDSLKITNLGEQYVCTNSQVELEATPPYIRQIDDETFDTTKLTYSWERIVDGESELVQEGKEYSFTDDDIPEGEYQYVVSVFHGECILSDTITLMGVEPTWALDTVRNASICSNKIDNLSELVFEEDDIHYVEGMALRKPSIEDLRQPGIYECWLNIPYDGNLCGDSIITLMLTVEKAFDTTIVENICLGDEYHQYGIDFIPTEEGVYYKDSPHWACTTGCDSIYHVTLIVNSVRSTLTDVFDETLVAWDMNTGINNFRPSCGTRTDDAKFKVLGTNATFTNNVGSDAPSGSCITESATGALRWPNLFSTCSKWATKTTDYSGVYFEITINPRDYNNLKLNFDYLRENEESTNGQAFDVVNYSYKLGEGTYSEPNTASLSGDSWSSVELDFSDAATLDTDKVTLKIEFTGGERGNTVSCGTITSYYLPSYLTVDNVMITGDRPARTALVVDNFKADYVPTGETLNATVGMDDTISICKGSSVKFHTQKDDKYLQFFLKDPVGNEIAFDGKDTMTVIPEATGDYQILARNMHNCDSAFTFPVRVTDFYTCGIDYVTSPAANICTGAPLAFAPADALPYTTYSWDAPSDKAFKLATRQSGTNQDSLRINLALEDTITKVTDVTYKLTPSTGGCPGTPFNVKISVYPEINASFTAPSTTVYCPGAIDVACSLKLDNTNMRYNRQLIWEFNGKSDTTFTASGSGTTINYAKKYTMPLTPCDTTYNVIATYTDSAKCRVTDTLAITVIDTSAPVLAEGKELPQDITGVDACFAAKDISQLASDADILVLYMDSCGSTITVTHTDDSTLNSNCNWAVVRTYTVTDACGNAVDPAPTMTLSGGDKTGPALASALPADKDNLNFTQANVPAGPTKATVKACFTDCCGIKSIDSTRVFAEGSTDCNWTALYVYTLTDSCDNVTKDTVTYKGGDVTAPTYTKPANATIFFAANGSFNADPEITGVPTNISKRDTTVTYTDKDTVTGCGYHFSRVWRVVDNCDNVSTSDSVQTIYVKDTIAPSITGNWADSTVYLANTCGYTLPTEFKTVAQMNELKSGFIAGLNLKNALTFTQSFVDSGSCTMYALRTYTVKDTCNDSTKTFTHKIYVKDTIAPALTGTWPTNIERQNNIFAHADTSGLYTDLQVKNLFSDCRNVTVTHKNDTPLVSNCGWTIRRVYTISDDCGNKFDSIMSVSGGNQNAPVLRFDGTWPGNITDQDNCLANADIRGLKADTAIAKLFTDTCGLSVTHKDSTSITSTNSAWTIIRTYLIKDSCDNYVTPAPTMTVSGGDKTAPALVSTDPKSLSQDNVDACMSGVTDGPTKAAIKAYFTDCSGIMSVDSSRVFTENSTDCDWTAYFIYKTTDSCNNFRIDTVTFKGGDVTAPVIAGAMVNDTIYYSYNDSHVPTYTMPTAIATVGALRSSPHVGTLTITDCSVADTTKLYASAPEEHNLSCGNHTFTITDTVADICGHKSTFTQTVVLLDTLKPYITATTWADSTVNMTSAGEYTLPGAFTTVSQINGLSSGFIKGVNLNNTLTMSADTTGEGTCDLKVVRTYVVTDSCSAKTDTFTHTIKIKDNNKPILAANNWADSTVYLTNTCGYTLPTAYQTVAEINGKRAGFITGVNIKPNVTMSADTTGEGTCDLKVVRTYVVTDSCSEKTDTFTHTIRVLDMLTPAFSAPKLNDTTVYYLADGTYSLLDTVKTLTQLNAQYPTFTVIGCNLNDAITMKQDTFNKGLCDMYVLRKYAVKDSCSSKVDTFTHKISISDTMKPVLADGKVWPNDSLDQNCLFAQALTAPLQNNDAIKALFFDATTLTVVHEDDTVSADDCEWKIVRHYTITDVCNNTYKDSITIAGGDKTNPVITCHTAAFQSNTDFPKDSLTKDGNSWDVNATDNKGVATVEYALSGATTATGSTTLNGVKFNTGMTLVEWTATDVCGNDTTCTDTVKIYNNKAITITSGSKTWDYDGNAHTFPSYTVTFGGVQMPRTADDSTKFVLTTGDTLTVTPSDTASVTIYTTKTNNNTFAYELQNAEYYTGTVTPTYGTINVNGYIETIKITSLGNTWTYDGESHSYSKYTVEFGGANVPALATDTTRFVLPTDTKDTLTITSTASIINAGKVTNTFTYTLDHNEIYVGHRDTICDTLRMLPLPGVVVEVVGHVDTAVYDGQLHTVTGFDARTENNLYNVDADVTFTCNEADTTAERRYAGKTEMTMTQAMFGNGNSNFTNVTFNITQGHMFIKPIEANIQLIADSAEKNYDGTPLTADGFTYTPQNILVQGDTIVAVVSGSQTEVGSSDNVITAYYVLRKTSPTAFDTINNCYTFATPATVKGLLKVNAALQITVLDSTNVDCYNNHNGKVVVALAGGKLIDGVNYKYNVTGPNAYTSGDVTTDTLKLDGLYPGTYNVVVTDDLDSTVSASFKIHQPDSMTAAITVPVASCPNLGSYDVSVTAQYGNGTYSYQWGVDATDADASSTVVAQTAASDCGTTYTAAVKVTDIKGCVAVDTVQFTVIDNEAPTFTVPANDTICRVEGGDIIASTDVTGVPTGYNDNCSNEATLIRHTTFNDIDTTGNVDELMVIRREWTVKDSCNNTSVDTQYIYIKPAILISGYSLTAPADVQIVLDYGAMDTLLLEDVIGTAHASNLPDGVDAPEITSNKPANDRYPVGVTYIVWTATDECGFTVTDTQMVTVDYPECEPVTYYGHEYPAVRLGGNCWTAENLRNTKYADGENIPNNSSYNNDGNLTDDYGLLYSWYSAVRVPEGNNNVLPPLTNGNVQGICPNGWAIPSREDFDRLFEDAQSTDALRDMNVEYWLPGAAGTTPNTGFGARAAGYYDEATDSYMNLLGETYFWTFLNGTTVEKGQCSVITHYCPEQLIEQFSKHQGFSVRCVRKE